MAKKINDAPRDPQTFLEGYKPIVPNLQPKPSVQSFDSPPEASATAPISTSTPVPTSITKCGDKEKEYERIFLSRVMPVKKNNRVYLSDDHFKKIQSVVDRLGRKYEGLNIGSFIWNILEEHFRTHGCALHNLIEENPQHNPFDEWK